MATAESARPEDGEPGRSRLSARSLALCLMALLALGGIARSWNNAGRWNAIDFYQFWLIGDALREGDAGDIYSPEERTRLGLKYYELVKIDETGTDVPRPRAKRAQTAGDRKILETYSTPWLYTVFWALGRGDYTADQRLFQRVSMALYVAGIALLCAMLGYSRGDALIAVAVLLEIFGPFFNDEGLGNVSRFQFGWLVLVAWLLTRPRLQWRDEAAGFVLGATIAFKPNIAMVAIVIGFGWLVTGQWKKLARVVAGSIAGAAFAVAASSAVFGSASHWLRWLDALRALMRPGQWVDPNYSLARWLREGWGIEAAGTLSVLVPAVALLCLFLGRARVAAAARSSDAASASFARRWDVFLIGLGATVPLVSAELSWFHYYISALILVFYLLRPGGVARASPGRLARRAIAFAAFAAFSIDVPRRLADFPVKSYIAVAVTGAVLLLAAALWEALGREAPAEA